MKNTIVLLSLQDIGLDKSNFYMMYLQANLSVTSS